MAIFKCKMCGGSLEISNGQTIAVCDYCGTQQTLPKLDDDRRANMYDRANHFRRNNEFDMAMGIYEQILSEDNTDAEAFWSLVLCRYGIEYVEDPTSQKRIPTINRAQYTSILEDADYKSALANADDSQRAIYEKEASVINDIQRNILLISQKEEPFDVFICYKETDSMGERTIDSVIAQDIYYQLTKENLKVFFARITLEDKLGTAYEPYIFAALNSAKVMIVIGSKQEHFNAPWVRNEWSRYLALVNQSRGEKVLIPAYKGLDPYSLPREFAHLQAQDMDKIGFMQDLVRGIKKLTGKNETKAVPKQATTANSSTNTNIAPMLERASMFLEDGEFNRADEMCEQVLNVDPKNGKAYLYKLLASLKLRRKEDLAKREESFENNNLYEKVCRFADKKTVEEINEYLTRIKQLIAQKEEEKRFAEEKKRILKAQQDAKKRAKLKIVAVVLGLIAVAIIAINIISHNIYLRDEAIRLEEQYNEMLELKNTGHNAEAYILCKRLQNNVPGYRDCSSLSSELEALILEEAEALYLDGYASDAANLIDWVGLYYPGYRYVANGDYAAAAEAGLTQIVIPNDTTRIDDFAFSNGIFIHGLHSFVIPAGVTSIGNGAFAGCSSLTNITIPDSVTSIGNETFAGCSSLKNIHIPDSVTEIGEMAFANCSSLESITVPNSVTMLGSRAFLGCTSLESISLPYVPTETGEYVGFSDYFIDAFNDSISLKTVKVTSGSIPNSAFAYCETLEEISIPSDTLVISDSMFYGCTSLRSFTIPENVEIIEYGAFHSCLSLGSIIIPDSVTSIGTGAFLGCYSLKNVTIGNGVTSISDNTFANCSSLTSVTIGNSVTNIDYCAFYKCSSLTDITIPDNVKNIGSSAFGYCDSLESITLGNNIESIDYNAFEFCSSLENVYISDIMAWTNIEFSNEYSNPMIYADNLYLNGEILTNLVIPEGVTSIKEGSFSGCSSLTSIIIPNSVTSIGKGAFSGCSSLASITIPFVGATLGGTENTHFGYIFGEYDYSSNESIPESLQTVIITGGNSIADHAFYDCNSLISITIGDSIANIGESAFASCSALTSIIIPGSITSFDEDAFYNCESLTNVYISSISAWTNIEFSNEYSTPMYYADNIYLNEEIIKNLNIPDGVTSIGNYAFRGWNSLVNVIIPDSVTNIGENAFYGCTSIESMTIPFVGASSGYTKNTYFGYIFGSPSYFYNRNFIPENLKTVIITGDHNIADYAFYDCDPITNITIGNGVTNISDYSFYDCNSLTSIVIGDSVAKIGKSAFSSCSALSSVTIGNSVTTIGENAFAGCSSLSSITISKNVLSIESFAFTGCSSLKSIVIPDNVLSVGTSAFSNCSSLVNVTIGNGVTTIGGFAFGNCNSLISADIGNDVIDIGEGAFSGCNSLTTITIPFVGANVVGVDNTHFGYIFGAYNHLFHDDCIPASLKSVIITGGNNIADKAFYGCSSLTNITISKSTTDIGFSAFEYCSSLTDIYYEGTEAEWGEIHIDSFNHDLTSATIHYNYVPEN